MTSNKLNNLEIKLSAPGKIILFGEHAVVYNKLAIAAAVDIRTHAELKIKRSLRQINFNCPNLKLKVNISADDILIDIFKPFINQINDAKVDISANTEQSGILLNIIYDYLKNDNIRFDKNDSSKLTALVTFFLLYIGILNDILDQHESFDLTIASELKIGSGIGSSASFCVCLSALFLQFRKLRSLNQNGYEQSSLYEIDKNDLELISTWALAGEQIIHGQSSGIDTTVCTYGSFIKYQKQSVMEPILTKNSFQLLLVNTKINRDAKKMIEIVAKFKAKFPEITEHLMDVVDIISNSALECVSEINNLKTEFNVKVDYFKKIMDLINLNQNILHSFGVSHVKIDQICKISSKYNLSGKLTGAGGGGFVIILIPPWYNEDEKFAMIKELNEADFEVITTKIGVPGVKIDNINF